MENRTPTTVDEYISWFPRDVQKILVKIREAIHESAPGSVEKISYKMPGFHLKGDLVWFAAYTRHIGFYPKGSGIEAFKGELSAFKWSKGAVQFPLDKPIPYDLIRRMVKYRAAQNLGKEVS